MLKIALNIILLISVLTSCNSEISKEEIFLKKIREIHNPVIANYSDLIKIIESVHKDCEENQINCSNETRNEIIRLKLKQDSLNKRALTELESLGKDKFGYFDAVKGFIEPNPYNYPFTNWELFFENLCYCNKEKEIVIHINKTEFDTIHTYELKDPKPFGLKIISQTTYWEGINKEKYLNQFNLVNKIHEADDWFCQVNRSHLSDDVLVHNNNP
jgi:hypothetical protein